MTSSREPMVLSLFSGCGGLDIGFHEQGFNITACLEIDEPSCKTMAMNLGRYLSDNTQIHNKDITKTEPQDLGLKAVDFIIGGPPCQSFSAAGRRAGGVHGVNDTRGSLFWYYCKYVEHFQPAGFLFENVKGILQANNSKDWELVQSSFSNLGYRLQYAVLDAADFGVPQHRERVILVGCRNGVDKRFKFPRPTHGPRGWKTQDYVTPEMALLDITDPHEEEHVINGKYGDLIPDIPPGMNYSFYTEKLGHPEPRFAWRSKFSGFLYKLPRNQPSKTLVANPGKYDGPFHWKNRKLTVSELQRIQGFPTDFVFPENSGQAIKQIGNSVAPKLASELAKAVKLQFFGANDIHVELDEISNEGHNSRRRAEKAAATKSKTRKVITTHNFQPDLFGSNKNYIQTDHFETEIEFDGHAFIGRASLKEGQWEISANAKGKRHSLGVELDLEFFNPTSCEFKSVLAVGQFTSFMQVRILWDLIHNAVGRSSSYESLSPLYGHFTEPYPRFVLRTKFNALKKLTKYENKMLFLLKKIMDFEFLSKNHPLELISDDVDEAISIIKKFIEYGFDIRTHETNRAIKEGLFKPCYPYTLPLSLNANIRWIEQGEHKTGDLKIRDLGVGN